VLIPIDEVVHFDITTHHPTTGAVTDADAVPTFAVFEEATDTPILAAQDFTKRTSLTGNYRGTFTASAANGFEAGKWYNVIASAAVNSIAGKHRTLVFRVAPVESVAGVPKADLSALDGGTAAATNLRRSAESIYYGTITGAATTTTLIDSGLTQADVDHWKGRIVIFLTGALAKQASDITAFDPTLDKLTFSVLSSAPSGGDTYVIV
jgi:hypothetical protein